MTRLVFYFLAVLVLASAAPAFGQNSEVRRIYIFDNAGVISSGQEAVIHSYLRGLDRAATNEIVIYTIPSFTGHGIKKDGVEIQDRDMLANYIYNEVTLDGIKGIGKEGKDNGVLVLMSLERDAGWGSLRIEVARTYYNDGVRDFNVHLRTFPNNTFNQSGFLGLGSWGLDQYTPFEATAAAQTTVPQVEIEVP